MSHHLEAEGWHANFNQDLSGAVEFTSHHGTRDSDSWETVEIPGALIAAIANYYSREGAFLEIEAMLESHALPQPPSINVTERHAMAMEKWQRDFNAHLRKIRDMVRAVRPLSTTEDPRDRSGTTPA